MLAGRRILVVEDEYIIADMLADILEDEGAQIVGPAFTLSDGLRAANGPIDAAVLDWNLGGQSGAGVARLLRRRQVPFLIATGYGAVEDEFAREVLLSKPYQPGRLIEELEALLGA